MTTTAATLETLFTANTSGFDSGIGHVKSALGGTQQAVAGQVTRIGDSLTRIGTALAPVTLALGGIGYASLNAASTFDSSMAEISARTGLVGQDLQRIREYALQMGADTAFSARESADAFLQLLTSGQSAEQAMATLPIVLDMAAASGEDLGYTADALTDIMAQFSLTTSDAAGVADALAQAAGASSADIASLTQGFANAGPVAYRFGLDVADTAATLAVLSENGIKGAEAGTALKSMLLNMTRDTTEVTAAWTELGTSFYDAAGNARPLEDVLADIKVGLEGMPVEEQNRLLQDLAGSYGVVALSALMGDLSIEGMKESMSEQATASDVAAARMDTFAGTFDQLKGAIETLQIEAFTPFMNDTLKPFVGDVAEAIGKVAAWAAANPELTKTIVTLGAGVLALGTATLALGPVISAVGAVIGALSLPLLAVAGVAVAVATNFGGIRDAIQQVIDGLKTGDLVSVLDGIVDTLAAIPMGIAEWIGKQVGIDVPAGMKAWEGVIDNIKTILSVLPGKIGAVITNLTGFTLPEAWNALKYVLSDIKGFVTTLITKVGDFIARVAEIVVPDALAVMHALWGEIAGFLGGLADLVGGFISAVSQIQVPGALREMAGLIGAVASGLGQIGGQILPGGRNDQEAAGRAGGIGAPTGMDATLAAKLSPAYAEAMFSTGRRDSGGRGLPGVPYLIGTGAQPEVFVPDSAGTFYPRAGGGAGLVIQGDLHLHGVENPRQMFDAIQAEARRRNVRMGHA